MIKTKVYAARHKNKKVLNRSSSGGLFTALSDYFLENNGAVVSAVYNYDTNQTEFQLYTTKETRDKAIGSKYMQAKPQSIFKDAQHWLKNNKGNLLFIGMGCQADNFRVFSEMIGFRNRVTIVGIICHGVPSPKIWKEYIGRRIDYLTFKDKRKGWKHPTALVIENGEEKSISDYVRIFYSTCALRPSCYECPYTTTERKVDITIGDFWGIDDRIPEFYSPKGNALALIHTEQGKRVWDYIKEDLDYVESNTTECLQPNLIKPTEKSPLRDQFWIDYKKGGINLVLDRYGNETKFSIFRRSVHKIKRAIENLLED